MQVIRSVLMFQSRLSPIPPFHSSTLIVAPVLSTVSISPESHPPFPQVGTPVLWTSLLLFQSRLSPIHPFHNIITPHTLMTNPIPFPLLPIPPFPNLHHMPTTLNITLIHS